MKNLIIIGGGPGGYVCAIRAAQNGLNVTLIESKKFLGGTCLNEGCIPSKALLESSHHFYNAKNHFADHGISVDPKVDIAAMLKRKEGIISSLAAGIDMLCKKNKITRIVGHAKFVSQNSVEVEGKIYEADNFVIATGSVVSNLPNITIDEEVIVSSTGALCISKTPQKMVVIGGGVIGLELGCVWSRLGSKVSVIEYADRILATMDRDISDAASKILTKQGLELLPSHKVLGVKRSGKKAIVEFEKISDNSKHSIEADIALIAVGRKPNTNGINHEIVGVKTDARGFIQVDGHYKCAQNIYAIGDVIPGPMLAHKAEDEGVAVADIIAGKYGHVNYNTIPSVVYTHPEIASVGKSEEQLKSDGIEYNIGKFTFAANSRAKAVSDIDGFVKILACKKTDRILGASIIGREAGNLIHEISVLIEFCASSEDLAMICHAHPTLNEAIKEAALAVSKRAIHS